MQESLLLSTSYLSIVKHTGPFTLDKVTSLGEGNILNSEQGDGANNSTPLKQTWRDGCPIPSKV